MSCCTTTIVTGDDFGTTINLYRDDLPFVIDSSATITVGVVTIDHKIAVIAGQPSVESSQSNWATSKIVVAFPAAVTAAAKPHFNKPLLFEIEVNDGGRDTFFVPGVRLVKGNI